jgi:hypothetical protein
LDPDGYVLDESLHTKAPLDPDGYVLDETLRTEVPMALDLDGNVLNALDGTCCDA